MCVQIHDNVHFVVKVAERILFCRELLREGTHSGNSWRTKKRALAQQLRRADVLLGTPLCHLCVKSVVILVFCDRMWWCMCEYLTSVCMCCFWNTCIVGDGRWQYYKLIVISGIRSTALVRNYISVTTLSNWACPTTGLLWFHWKGVSDMIKHLTLPQERSWW